MTRKISNGEIMNKVLNQTIRSQLIDRRKALERSIAQVNQPEDLVRLLSEVDRALERVGTDAFGRCVVCGEYCDDNEMLENPMRQYCLCDLSEHGTAALQRDLDLAWQVQASLLPPQNLTHANWQTHYRYQPAGPVSGDYCDLITHQSAEDWLYFLVGDVSGKGVAASYLMAHLSALVRRTLDVPVTLDDLMNTVNRHLSQRSPSTHFVTLVAGRAHASGRVEISNAGHCLPIVLRDGANQELESDGLPVGIWDDADYGVTVSELSPGDSIVLFTDGISEALNPAGDLYGTKNLTRVAARHRADSPPQLAAACLDDVNRFRESQPVSDDLTLMVLRRQ